MRTLPIARMERFDVVRPHLLTPFVVGTLPDAAPLRVDQPGTFVPIGGA
jgi:hypothetical protein